MKSKRLIELIQKCDPSGEMEVCVGNEDIYVVYCEMAYWDGRLQVLQRDESNPYYNVTGGRFVSSGKKLVLRPLSIYDAIENDPDLPVDYSDLSPLDQEQYTKQVNDHREMVRRVNKELDEKFGGKQ